MLSPLFPLIEQLFDAYSSNLESYIPNLKGYFLCPLCGRLFSRPAIESGEITIEHIIPEALGGHLKTLTCKQCNNQSGTLIDSHLVQRFRTEDILAGKTDNALRVKVKIGDGEFTADLYLSVNNPQVKIVGLPEYSDPESAKQAFHGLDTGATKFTVSATLGYKKLRSQIAILRSAYLLMFRYFGYGYILSPELNVVRDQIGKPDLETPVLNGIISLSRVPPQKNIVTILTEPKDLVCFHVILDLSTETERFVGIVMPGLGKDTANVYERWASIGEDIKHLETTIKIIPFDQEFVSDPKYTGFPSWLWQSFNKPS